MMRILLASDTSDEIGGTEVYVASLQKWLCQEGHDVAFLADSESSRILRFLRSFFNITAFRRAIDVMSDYRPDLLHAHNVFERLSITPLLAAKRLGIPVIVTVSDYYHYICPKGTLRKKEEVCDTGFCLGCIASGCLLSESSPVRILEWFRLYVHRLVMRRLVSVFICPSELIRKWIEKSMNLENVVTLPPAIEVDAMSSHARNHNTPRIILFAGRLAPEKGARLLIRAMGEIVRIHPDVHLRILGEGAERPDLERTVKMMHLENEVEFLGAVTRQQVPLHYGESDLLVLPSLCVENYPLVVAEALVHGLPVVVSDMGGQTEIVKNGFNGYIFEAGNLVSLVGTVREALDDESLRERVESDVGRMRNHHSPAEHVRCLLGIYNRATRRSMRVQR